MEFEKPDFSIVIENQYEMVKAYFLLKTHNLATAEDLAQQTFLNGFRAYGRFTPGRPVSAWIWMIARNTLYSHYRGFKPVTSLDSFRTNLDDEEDELDLEDRDSRTPFEEAEASYEAETLADAVQDLIPAYREIIDLHYMQDLTFSEMTIVTGKKEANLRTRALRAKNKLREKLSEELG